MILYLQDLSRPGAAVLVTMAFPCRAQQMKLLRRWDNAFPEIPDDPQASVIYADEPVASVLDWHAVLPGIEHWYQPYFFLDGTWQRSGEPRVIVPTVQAHEPSMDSLDVIRERLEIGLNALLRNGLISHPRGVFAVLTAPPIIDDNAFPMIAVRLQQGASETHVIGGYFGTESLESGDVREFDGWLSRYRVQVEIWSLNPDERRLLRRAVRDILVANRDILEVLGLQELDVTFGDDEDYESHSATIYRTHASLSYLAPDVVWTDTPAIGSVPVSINVDPGL